MFTGVRERGRPARKAAPTLRLARCHSCKPPVIPAKAGIQSRQAKPAIRNQIQIAVSGSLLPLWEKARMRARRPPAAYRAGRPRSQGGIPTCPCKPLWERARGEGKMPASRGSAGGTPALPGGNPAADARESYAMQDARAPRWNPNLPFRHSPASPPLCVFAPLRQILSVGAICQRPPNAGPY